VDSQKVFDYIFTTTGFEMTAEQQAYYDSLSPEDQKVYTTAYLTVSESIDAGTEEGKARLREWAASKGRLSEFGKGGGYVGSMLMDQTYDYGAIASAMSGSYAASNVASAQAARESGPADGTDGGGGGGGGAPEKTAEEIALENMNNQLSKQQKALSILSFQEDEINKKYEKRKEALQQIADINAQIAEEQKQQLSLANALASGDIAAAAQAAQEMRASAAQQAIKDQEKAMEAAQKRELASVTFEGKTRDQLESQITDLQKQIAELEYRMPQAAKGGLITGPGTSTSDSIPTMLSNGEYVVRASSVAKIGLSALEAINAGKIPELTGGRVSIDNINLNGRGPAFNKQQSQMEASGSVYNYSVVVNAQTNSNPDQIASAVMDKIKQVEGQRVRGVIR
jgi:hypothetical protein